MQSITAPASVRVTLGTSYGMLRLATKSRRGTKLMAMADGARKTIVVRTAPASPPEVPRIPDTLAQTFTTELPERMIGDQAYDVPPCVAYLPRSLSDAVHDGG